MSLHLKDKGYRIIVQGCRTNQYEGEAIASALEKEGAVCRDEAPDITVVVTCTITSVADRKCRKIIRRVKRENASSAVVVCGCYVQKMKDAERQALGIDIAVGNRLKHKIPELLNAWFAEKQITPLSELDHDILSAQMWDKLELDHPRLRTRAFLKIQDGCDHYCSYCIVPYVRGNPVSRDAEDVMNEVVRVAASGCPEIVLTGIHIGLYQGLGDLILRINAVPGIRRIRLGSLEPFAADEKLIDVMAAAHRFSPHLHLPLQSGDDGVLKKMRRGYNSAEFAGIIALARKKLGEDLHVSTDLMVGFPGEDERAFENSLRFVREMGFGKIHVFPYSSRSGTDAALLPFIDPAEVQARTRRALDLAASSHETFAKGWIGKKVPVLVEEVCGDLIKGLTPHFVRVIARGVSERGEETLVMPESYTKEVLLAGIFPEDLLKDEKFDEFL